jgi:hypothetical protein
MEACGSEIGPDVASWADEEARFVIVKSFLTFSYFIYAKVRMLCT